MQIIFSKEAADELRDRYTVLELDTVEVEGKVLEAFCVIGAEQVMNELGTLELNKQLHEQLVDAMKKDDAELAKGLTKLLQGNFSGELDSFYEEVAKRIDETGSTKLKPVTA